MDSVRVKAWGNSQAIRIPKKYLNLMDINISDELQIELIDNKLTLSKPFKHKTFEERVAEYEGNISVCNFDWGEPKGREML